jgi:hypothetical protein
MARESKRAAARTGHRAAKSPAPARRSMNASIRTSHAELAAFAVRHVTHEGALETAFMRLLADTARPRGWFLVPKQGKSDTGDRIVPDETVRDEYKLPGACMRKPVMICYGVLKNRAPFDPRWASRIAPWPHATWSGVPLLRRSAAASPPAIASAVGSAATLLRQLLPRHGLAPEGPLVGVSQFWG